MIGLLAVLIIAALPVPANAAATPPIRDLGPGVVSAPITGAARDGQNVYLVSRGLQPVVVARFDLATRKIAAHTTLPTGIGGWAATVSGGQVYAGTYHPADVYHYDPATNTATRTARLGAEEFVWDLATGPDGTLYAGTYPNGKVFAVDPKTGATRDFGQISTGQQYVRSIAAASDGTVYAGTGTAARLVAVDPKTGGKTDITPPELRTESMVYDIAVSNDVVAFGTEPSGKLAVIDRHDPSKYTIVDTDDHVLNALTIDGGEVLAAGSTSGNIYRYDLATGKLTTVGTPLPQDENRGIFADNGQIVGVAGTGQVWTLDRASGAVQTTDIVTAGMPTSTEPVQSVSVQGGRYAYVGGNFGLQVHDQTSGTSTHVRIGGEAKTAIAVDGKLYLAVYPGAYVDTYDPSTGKVVRRGELGGIQNRPRAMAYLAARGQLGIGSRSNYGHTGGAFALVDVRTNRITRFDDVIPDQGITAVTFAGARLAYLGGEIYADGLPPVSPAAQLATFDLHTGKVVRLWTPVPGAGEIADLLMHNGLLYGVTDAGVVFVADPRRQTVPHTYRLADHSAARLFQSRHGLLAVTANSVFRLGDTSAEPIVTGLHGDWYNNPQPAYDARADVLYTIRARNLVSIDLRSLRG
ncbi:PQQ-binding-like beta-propeller repeat protein [Fodinicola acaciae]|uniref:outer membrane protein assembly factor BamB family protein n=1 Tax=Fodinicola acaciae TaxID=2681555 RepID=UPI0013D3C35C|nr:PQQ-binding-like beta-propeller repeat protein [Fodinicola acaciae]